MKSKQGEKLELLIGLKRIRKSEVVEALRLYLSQD